MARFIPAQEGLGEYEDRGSRFLTYVFHAPEEAVFQQRLAELRAEHPKACHHCWAWRIGKAYRFSDDGEPGGTAGRPMLQVLEGSGLEDIGAICVRYFGGTKLGTGGLARAYSAATAQGVQEAGRFEVIPRVCFELELPFAALGLRTELAAVCTSIRFHGDFVAAGWAGQVELDEAEQARFAALLAEKSGGRVSWRKVER
jgi:uncharacterized YigZ family protein